MVETRLPDVDAAWPGLERSSKDLCDLLGRGATVEELEQAFQDLADLLIAIFRREEEAMAASADPRSLVHRQGHLALLSTLAGLRAAACTADASPREAIRVRTEFMDSLHEHHIMLDALLGRHIRNWLDESDSFDESMG